MLQPIIEFPMQAGLVGCPSWPKVATVCMWYFVKTQPLGVKLAHSRMPEPRTLRMAKAR
jgi:hypothetical protein